MFCELSHVIFLAIMRDPEANHSGQASGQFARDLCVRTKGAVYTTNPQSAAGWSSIRSRARTQSIGDATRSEPDRRGAVPGEAVDPYEAEALLAAAAVRQAQRPVWKTAASCRIRCVHAQRPNMPCNCTDREHHSNQAHALRSTFCGLACCCCSCRRR